MDICGNVYVAKDIKSFSFKCIYCDMSMEQWPDFMCHIQNFHCPLDETWIDPLIEDSKEDILIEEIKQEMDVDREELKDETYNTESSRKGDDCSSGSAGSVSESESNSDDEENDLADSKYPTKFNPSFFRRNPRTIEFIELYKSFPCLWDPNDDNYRNFPLRAETHKKMRTTIKIRFNMRLTDRSLKAAIKKIHKQYRTILQQKSKTGPKLLAVVQEHFEKCSFLSVLDESLEDISNTIGNINNLIFWKENDVTNAFIAVYARFPILYDPNHSDYANFAIRKHAYQGIITMLKADHNVVFSVEDIHKGIYGLRQWYYKIQSRTKNAADTELSETQKMYVQKCNFLPPKLVKIKLPCKICGQVSNNETTLQVHMYKKHQLGELPHKCSDCERSFEQKSALIIHQQRNHIGKVHQCEYCERRFAVQIDLRRHIRTHTGERPFVCELCGKAFPRITQLGYHTDAVHTKTRAFKCTMCPKDFLKRGDLNDHIKAHLNIRDKICETCGKGFTNCHSLIRHRQIHSEVKKFVCKLCDAKFHQFVGLNSHMKRTHNIVKKKSNN